MQECYDDVRAVGVEPGDDQVAAWGLKMICLCIGPAKDFIWRTDIFHKAYVMPSWANFTEIS